jgi:hypothetical protein
MTARLQRIQSHLCSGASTWPNMLPEKVQGKKKLAIISTVWSYFTHPEHMGDCWLHGWGMGGGWHEPGLEVVSMYVDQQADKNPHDQTSQVGIHRQRAEEFGFELFDDIGEALRCGGETLAVDAVLIIGEHGACECRAHQLHPVLPTSHRNFTVFHLEYRVS